MEWQSDAEMVKSEKVKVTRDRIKLKRKSSSFHTVLRPISNNAHYPVQAVRWPQVCNYVQFKMTEKAKTNKRAQNFSVRLKMVLT